MPQSGLAHRLRSPILLVVLATAFWGGNAVVGRALIPGVSPLAVSFWRWAIALAVLAPIAWRGVRAAWPAVRRNWPWLAAQGIVGIGINNTVVNYALAHTTAINSTVVYAASPMMIMALARLVLGDRLRGVQVAGLLLSFLGVLTLISRGDPAMLPALDFNRGDLLVLLGGLCWAVYSLLLRRRTPELSPTGLLFVLIATGAAALLPFYAWEVFAAGVTFEPTGPRLAALAYVGILPSVVSFYFWNRGVQALGPATAGLFVNVTPVFASLFSIVWLDEVPQLFHAFALALLFAGLYVATRPAPPLQAPRGDIEVRRAG
ncbi:MAG: EamA family transporter [Alphaproteobacteria bacterium]|nr:EamA family transporter [Alphaproteobacteria bacterium]